jgi:hypothetical protein
MDFPVISVDILKVFKLVGMFAIWLCAFSPVIGLILWYVLYNNSRHEPEPPGRW